MVVICPIRTCKDGVLTLKLSGNCEGSVVSGKFQIVKLHSTSARRLAAAPSSTPETKGAVMSEQKYSKPLPVIEPLTQPYWEHAASHRLSVQCCDDCGDLHFPPSPVCPACLSQCQSWKIVSGNASLLTWGRFHRAYWNAFKDDLPYDVCVVKLAEGPVIISNFFGATPEKLQTGMALKAVFDDVTPGISLVRFMKS